MNAHAEAAPRPHESTRSTLMTIEEVSEYLRFHPSTVYRLVRRGQLPGVKLGKQWRFDRHALEDWLRVNTVGGDDSVAR